MGTSCDIYYNSTSTKVKNLVEYRGISSSLPSNPTIFTQFSVSQTLTIPTVKPDIERVIRIDTSVCINKYKVIKTPIGTSLEGQILTGFKALVNLTVNYTVMYVANDTIQSVHTAHFAEDICQYIVLPISFSLSTPIKVIPYVENVSACIQDLRNVSVCTVLFLDLRTCVGCCYTTCNSCSLNDCAKSIGTTTNFPTNPIYFKEVILENDLVIPTVKPDIEGIISIASDIKIVSANIVSTDTKTSIEGQNLSGCKLILELKQIDVLVYTADTITQSVHSAHYESNLNSVFVIVPCQINGIDIKTLFENCQVKVVPYIEDICVMRKDSRTAKKCLTLFLNVSTIGV